MTAIHATTRSAVALGAAAVTGIAAGGLTAYLQGVLSEDWNTIANSGAIWTVVAFAAAALLGRSYATAALAGTLVLVGEVAGYYSYVSDVAHIPALHSAELLWTLAAVWIGPLAGLGAYLARWGRADHRVIALAAVCGVIAGEGVYLVRLAGVPRAGWVEVLIGLAGAGAAVVAVPASLRARVSAVGVGLAIAASVYVAYSQPLLA
jgi:hypothetical protein